LAYSLPWENVLQHTKGNGDAAMAQAVIAPMTIAIALCTGLIAGAVSKKVGCVVWVLSFWDLEFAVGGQQWVMRVDVLGI
jgi:hypothetical protein